MGYIGNAPYQGLVTGDNVLDGSITAQDLAPGAAVPSQTGNSGKYLTTDGTNASWGALSQVRVTSIDYPGDDTATLPAGGATLTLTGTGFAATPMVFVDGTLAPSVSFVSSTQITFVAPAKSAGTYHLYIVNPDGATAIFVNGISYSGVPTWTTAAGSLGTYGETFSIQLQATSDSAVTYALATGSSLPGGVTLSSGGLISGTINSEQTFSFSVDAIDAENQETPRSFSVTIVLADPFFKSNVLLLPGNGTNGAQNNTFLDSSTNAFSITRNGNTTQGTFSPFSQTGWSNYFDGTGDYLSIADNTALDMGSSDFTIECWVYPVANQGGSSAIFGKKATGGTYGGVLIYFPSTGLTPVVLATVNGSSWGINFTSSISMTLNQWYHLALTRSGSTWTIYVNGTSGGSASLAGTIPDNSAAFTIGAGAADGDLMSAACYISNFRVVKGTAVYTSNFTPSTTPLTAITNTSLLTCQSNRFIDNSSNAFAITRNGDVSIQPFSPFNPTAAWSASTNGGSGYFDGSGDYLTAPSDAAWTFGTGDFTVEAWIYQTGSLANYKTVAGNIQNGSDTTWYMLVSSTGTLRFQSWNLVPLSSTATLNLNSWNHVVAVRSGTDGALFLNGTRVATASSFTQNFSTNATLYIGRSNPDNVDWTGYISGLRIVKGSAVYSPSSTTITIPTAPPTAVTNTQLLCNFTNAGIYDATSKNDLETVGNAQISTTQSKFGGSSMYFDGTGDGQFTPNSPNLTLGTGDFTIEFWVYRVGNSVIQGLFDQRTAAANEVRPTIYISSGNNISFYVSAADRITGALTQNAWIHVAVVRYSGSTKMYLNGVAQATTYSDTNNYLAPTSGTRIGYLIDGFSLNGYINDLRITKGIARYTSNFTPPTTAHKLR